MTTCKLRPSTSHVKTITTKDGILKKFTFNIDGLQVEGLTIYPSNYIYVKLDRVRDSLNEDTLWFLPGLSALDSGHQFETVTITFQEEPSLHDDYDEFNTARLHIANQLNFDNSVIKGKSWANGLFKTSTPPAARKKWAYKIHDFNIEKAVATEKYHGHNKKPNICLAHNFIVNLDNDSILSRETRINHLINQTWSQDMYLHHGSEVKKADYIADHFMDGYIRVKIEDYHYIRDGYKHHRDPTKGHTSIQGFRQDMIYNFIISRQLKPFLEILTMNKTRDIEFMHGKITDVFFTKSKFSDVTGDYTAQHCL